ncbi:hypothetical protein BDV59DRAFT_169504 [Aspergillus ambiguus]|uniref:uncharacterized protein n=1 Tax=Aspergillus ambiguus TaxID=176160 RepID=UPI003CCE05D2
MIRSVIDSLTWMAPVGIMDLSSEATSIFGPPFATSDSVLVLSQSHLDEMRTAMYRPAHDSCPVLPREIGVPPRRLVALVATVLRPTWAPLKQAWLEDSKFVRPGLWVLTAHEGNANAARRLILITIHYVCMCVHRICGIGCETTMRGMRRSDRDAVGLALQRL